MALHMHMEPRSLIDPDLELVALVRCGAHLYGTATPASDLDLKGVYLPAAEEILLQRIRATVVTRASNAGTKSQAGEVEVELFSLDRYLALLAAGQTIALDMLFAPEDAMIEAPTPLWLALRREAPRLVTRRATSFVRYARRQAALFGIKGSRLAGARRVLERLEAATAHHGGAAKLSEILPQLEALAAHEEHVAILRLPTASGGELAHLDLGGRKVPLTASLDRARELARHVVASYGRRAREAA